MVHSHTNETEQNMSLSSDLFVLRCAHYFLSAKPFPTVLFSICLIFHFCLISHLNENQNKEHEAKYTHPLDLDFIFYFSFFWKEGQQQNNREKKLTNVNSSCYYGGSSIDHIRPLWASTSNAICFIVVLKNAQLINLRIT